MAKALIDPHTGHRWVPPLGKRKWYVRKLFSHGAELCMRIPLELKNELNLSTDSYVMLKRTANGIVFEVLQVDKGREEKEAG